jgi:hypothetical protein
MIAVLRSGRLALQAAQHAALSALRAQRIYRETLFPRYQKLPFSINQRFPTTEYNAKKEYVHSMVIQKFLCPSLLPVQKI